MHLASPLPSPLRRRGGGEEKQERNRGEEKGELGGDANPDQAAPATRADGTVVDGAETTPGAFSTCGTTSLIVLVSDLYVICCNTGDSRSA